MKNASVKSIRPGNRFGGAASQTKPASPTRPALENLSDRLTSLLGGFNELAQRLEVVADRQFGGEPKSDASASTAPAVAPGAVERLLDLERGIEAQLSYLVAQIERLEQL